jgi:hypothetical protein
LTAPTGKPALKVLEAVATAPALASATLLLGIGGDPTKWCTVIVAGSNAQKSSPAEFIA